MNLAEKIIFFIKGRVERGQRNKQGRMEEEPNQLYRRTQMTGQARDEEDHLVQIVHNVNIFFNFIVCVFIGGSRAYTCKEDLDRHCCDNVFRWTQGPSPSAASRVIYVFFKCWV